MAGHYIEAYIQRTNRNLLITNLILFVVVFAVALPTRGFLYDMLSGPYPMDRQTLLGLHGVNNLQKRYVTLSGDLVLDTGMSEVTTGKFTGTNIKISESATAAYIALVFDQRLLLIRAPVAYTGTHYTGMLVPVSSDVQDLIHDMVIQEPKLKGVFLPFMLDAVEDYLILAYVEVVVVVLLGALAVWNLAKFVQRSANLTAHPVYRALAPYGPPEAVAASVDAEASSPGVIHIGSTVLTPHWILHRSTYSVNAVRLEDLVWVYLKATQRRTYGIKTGKTFATMLVTKQGKSMEIIPPKGVLETDIVASVVQRAPWVFVGYTAELVKAWRVNRSALLQALADRQRDWRK